MKVSLRSSLALPQFSSSGAVVSIIGFKSWRIWNDGAALHLERIWTG